MEGNCPKCENHCSADKLKCPEGRKYFGIKSPAKKPEELTVEDQILILLRRCGHYLHHYAGSDVNSAGLLAGLEKNEKAALAVLLQKCQESWRQEQSER